MNPVLIVEDNQKNLKLVRDLLQATGYTTLEAVSAEEGLALARAHLPDLILMDIRLPGMSGIDALRALRADPATARIPVIAITASVMQHNRREIEAVGFDGFIEKPINVRGFLETVRVALERAPR